MHGIKEAVHQALQLTDFLIPVTHNRNELEQYQQGLSLRPHAIVANKMDLPEAQVLQCVFT